MGYYHIISFRNRFLIRFIINSQQFIYYLSNFNYISFHLVSILKLTNEIRG